jgi:hypothetical protein
MRIDKRLNLVVPIYGEEIPKLDAAGKPVMENGEPVTEQPVIAQVHATPLPSEVVDRYFMILAQTFSAIFSNGLGVLGGPAVAMKLLKSLSRDQKIWDDDPRTGLVGVKKGVVDEIERLTTVNVPDGSGWTPVPLAIAVERNFISEEDKAEVENAIVFFIVGSATLARAQRKEMLTAAAGLWGARTSPLSSTEFTDSLKTSTGTVNSGEKSPAPAPSAPGPANAMVDGKPASLPV